MIKPKRDNGETLLGIAYINWMRGALPDVLTYHVRNENAQNSIQGKQFKDRGVLAGVHDYHLLWVPREFATLELKNPNIRASEAVYSDKQQSYAERMDKIGFRHACCQNGKQIEAYILSLGLKPLYRFPLSLASSGKQMMQQIVFHEMNRP